MAPTIPTTEPKTLVIGTSWDWDKSFGDFPASDGWQLSYYLVSKTAPNSDLTIAWSSQVSADGDGFEIRCAPSFSADADPALTPGAYDLIGVVTDGTDTYQLDPIRVEIRANPATVKGSKSHALFMLTAIEARQQGRALSQEQRRVQINGREIEHAPDEELRKAAAHWRTVVELEKNPSRRLTHAGRFVGA